MSTTPDRTSADQTRHALVATALRLFGSKGFEATSTREIAAAANANIGSIAYHFGGKEGLREACALHVVETIRGVAGPALAAPPAPLGPQEAEAMLEAVAGRMAHFVAARPEAGDFVQFILREVAGPSPALDIIYSGLFEPVHRRFCLLWEQATGEPAETPRTRLTVFTLIGQVVYFRIAREAVLRRMEWTEIGPQEAGQIAAVMLDNIRAVLASRKEAGR